MFINDFRTSVYFTVRAGSSKLPLGGYQARNVPVVSESGRQRKNFLHGVPALHSEFRLLRMICVDMQVRKQKPFATGHMAATVGFDGYEYSVNF